MKKLIVTATIVMLSSGAFAAPDRALVARAPVDTTVDTRTHHCQQVSDTKVHCVNWANGKYNSHYHENCNEITCKKEVAQR